MTMRTDATWNEGDHPCDDSGQFSRGAARAAGTAGAAASGRLSAEHGTLMEHSNGSHSFTVSAHSEEHGQNAQRAMHMSLREQGFARTSERAGVKSGYRANYAHPNGHAASVYQKGELARVHVVPPQAAAGGAGAAGGSGGGAGAGGGRQDPHAGHSGAEGENYSRGAVAKAKEAGHGGEVHSEAAHEATRRAVSSGKATEHRAAAEAHEAAAKAHATLAQKHGSYAGPDGNHGSAKNLHTWAAAWHRQRVTTGDARRTVKDAKGYYAPEKLGKTRSVTPEGFLLCEGVPIARTGTQLYSAQELDVEPNGAGYVVVERPVGEVFHPDTLASFEGKPITVEHPPEGVVPENYKEHAVGHVQNVRRGGGVEDDLILADFLITDPHAIKYVNKELPEVSAGYNADYEQTEAGRATQRKIIGNHVALVKAGRAGSRVAVRDSATPREVVSNMPRTSIGRIVRLLVQHGVPVKDAEAEASEAMEDAEEPGNKAEREILKKLDSIGDRVGALEKDRRAADSFNGLVEKLEKGGKSKEYATKVAGKVAKEKGCDAEPEELDRRVRDAEAELKREEDAARAKDAAEAERAREADAARARDAGGAEAEEAEKVGDTVLEAESIGKVVNLGKLYTGDSGQKVDVLADVASKAEILAPGIKVPTADSLKGNKGTALAAFMRQALEAHAGTKDGADNVKAFALGQKVSELRGGALLGAFNGAAQLARAQNNRRGTAAASRRQTGDGSKAVSVGSINERNKKFWADRAAAQQGGARR